MVGEIGRLTLVVVRHVAIADSLSLVGLRVLFVEGTATSRRRRVNLSQLSMRHEGHGSRTQGARLRNLRLLGAGWLWALVQDGRIRCDRV